MSGAGLPMAATIVSRKAGCLLPIDATGSISTRPVARVRRNQPAAGHAAERVQRSASGTSYCPTPVPHTPSRSIAPGSRAGPAASAPSAATDTATKTIARRLLVCHAIAFSLHAVDAASER
jgi:hypothetical protein